MSNDLRDRFNEYINENFAPEDDVLKSVQSETVRQGMPQISISPYEGRMMQILIAMTGAKKIIEVGTLAGYSGIWIGRALPEDGQLITIEKSSKHADIARSHFEKAGLSHKVTVYQGDGLQILKKIQAQAPFDMVFIDADKPSYDYYLEWAVENLRLGGTVMAHNAFFGGGIFDPQTTDDHAMMQFNQTLAKHPKLESTIIGVGDGLAVGVKVR